MNDKEEIQALKEWALSTFVQKDACSDRHEKTDEWLGGIAAGASIGSIITSLCNTIFK